MVIEIKIYSVGKTKEAWLETAISDYLRRLQGQVELCFVIAKDDEQLLQRVQRERKVIYLDEGGQLPSSSPAFSTLFYQWVEAGGSRLSFVIGGPLGLPAPLKNKPREEKLSLSPLTLTHQMVRLLLVEQVYRAVDIAKGGRYHH